MVQKAAQKNGRRKRKGGPATVEGRRHQIESRLGHGIRSRSPVLLHLESPRDWQQHLAGTRRSFDPGDEFEECLVHLIAYRLWCWIGRLLPYECVLTSARMATAPNDLTGFSALDIQAVLTQSSEKLCASLCVAQQKLDRYAALQNGDTESVFTKSRA